MFGDVNCLSFVFSVMLFSWNVREISIMNVVSRAKNIIMTPKTEWAVIASEDAGTNTVFLGYALPLIVLSAAAAFIGYGFLRSPQYLIGGLGGSPLDWGLHSALMIITRGILEAWVTALAMNALAPNFRSEKNPGRAMQLVVYSLTPLWIGGLLMIFPRFGYIGLLFGLYGVYLMYLGLPHMMKTPADKVVAFMMVPVIVLLVIYLAIAVVF